MAENNSGEPQGDVSAAIWRHRIAHKITIKRRALALTRGNNEEADELMSATAIRLAEYFHRHSVDLQNPIAFLFTVLRNEFISQCRRRRQEMTHRDLNVDVHDERLDSLHQRTPSPEDQYLGREIHHHLMDAIIALSPLNRRLFELRFWEDRPYGEIAEALSISEVLVRKRVQLLRKKLKDHLAQSTTSPRYSLHHFTKSPDPRP